MQKNYKDLVHLFRAQRVQQSMLLLDQAVADFIEIAREYDAQRIVTREQRIKPLESGKGLLTQCSQTKFGYQSEMLGVGCVDDR